MDYPSPTYVTVKHAILTRNAPLLVSELSRYTLRVAHVALDRPLAYRVRIHRGVLIVGQDHTRIDRCTVTGTDVALRVEDDDA